MRWRCAQGHVWEAVSGHILAGRWCPFCSGRRTTLAALQALAAERGGQCLSQTVAGKGVPHEWRCGVGHTWSATPSALIRGNWCPTCAGRPIVTLESLRELARSRGGECLAEDYRGVRHALRWRCELGHTWDATPHLIKHGSWCPHCAGNARGDLQGLQALAQERGFLCLATAYVNAATKVPWRCPEGHTWVATPIKIKAGTSCPKCPRTATKRPSLTFAELLALVREQAGHLSLELPDATRVPGRTEVELRCVFGHVWTTSVAYLRRGHWCPHCAGVARGSLEPVQALALARGGRCLATEYIDSRTSLRFECASGHQWDARPHTVQRSWCPQCAPTARLDLETLQNEAKVHGGRCLADAVIGGNGPLEWECAKGHHFMARPSSVRRKHWCPTCQGHGTYTLARARRAAAVHGGECLSTKCSRALDRLRWRCDMKHVWTAMVYRIVREGSWCPRCSKRNSGRRKAGDTRPHRPPPTPVA